MESIDQKINSIVLFFLIWFVFHESSFKFWAKLCLDKLPSSLQDSWKNFISTFLRAKNSQVDQFGLENPLKSLRMKSREKKLIGFKNGWTLRLLELRFKLSYLKIFLLLTELLIGMSEFWKEFLASERTRKKPKHNFANQKLFSKTILLSKIEDKIQIILWISRICILRGCIFIFELNPSYRSVLWILRCFKITIFQGGQSSISNLFQIRIYI